MKHNVWYVVFLQSLIFCAAGETFSQEKMNSLLRIYVDNDFFNIRGKGTDRAYSGGLRFDLFYEKSKRSTLVPAFGVTNDSMVYMGQWGIMQMVFTPGNISDPYFQPHDYCYSGAIFISHSQVTYNRSQQYSFQTEFQLGVRGPAALGQHAQTFFHRIIGYTIPRGWDNQLRNAPIVNLNFAFEKQIALSGRKIELMVGVKSFLGTLKSGLSMYPVVRLGIMKPYFNGYVGHFFGNRNSIRDRNIIQAYLIIRPDMQIVLNNALLGGGAFSSKPIWKVDSGNSSSLSDYSDSGIRHFVYSIGYGVVMARGKFGLSFIQNTSSEMKKGTYSHEFGNISMYFAL